ncbi:alpha/beta hydrolase [Mycolicibacterium cyprinidarum]|uniref:Alpha/beta hydrolase n=1 Tax=Mycolicibacterium cyprinidarum TaxID=2860311 RepID=A0ABQ4V6J3_9MYCO|nr:alpha/beta hydrolase [Mycolicibacterium sp. NGTWS1803]GJF11252.1 alpha/beta hydrolase [Mycolicibacterium sp. NGTWSNA01]GJF13708.1 alpha/beta hydrolase [Mycolicibacterium sp. NGTWS0302]
MSGWEPDVLPGYWQCTLPLGPDPDGEGELEATLVRRGVPDPSTRRAVLMIHGFTDYFFNTELADRFAARGIAPYALDLHKCGRSHRDGQTPHFTTDLDRYDVELERALDAIAAECDAQVLIYGHSAGGLIVSLWLDRRRRTAAAGKGVSGLILNSPWLDLQGHPILRLPPTSAAIRALGRLRKTTVVRRPTEGGYGTTLHRDYHGEFDYDLAWKPLGGFPVTFGWIHAIRRGQSRLHRGLDVGVPNLVLRSDHSVREVSDPSGIDGVGEAEAIERMQRGDAVLDVTQIARWAGCIGNRTTIAPIIDAKHDVFLSVAEPRQQAYAELDHWLDWHLDETSSPPTQSDESE